MKIIKIIFPFLIIGFMFFGINKSSTINDNCQRKDFKIGTEKTYVQGSICE